MRSGVLVIGLSLAGAVMCSSPRKDDDAEGDAGAGGEGLDSSGGRATGGKSARGGSGGSAGSVPPAGGEGGDGPGSGGTAGESGQSTGGSAGSGGSSNGGASGNGGAGGNAGGVAGSMAGTTSGGAGGSNGGSSGAGGSSAGNGGTGGGGASGTVLFFDDFESGTDGWTPTPSGIWATATDGSTVYAATGATGATARTASAGELTWTNVQIDARVKITSFVGSSSGYFAGICARYQSASVYACFTLRSNGQVAFRVNNSNTSASNPPAGAITEGVWYTVRVVAIGSNITAFINGTEVAAGSRVTSGAPTSGRIALSAPGTNAVFDDIRVTAP